MARPVDPIKALSKKKRWKTNKRHWFKGDGSKFVYYSIEEKKQVFISKEELAACSEYLPIECQRILEDSITMKRNLTPQEHSRLLKLCSISISIWNGGPKDSLPYVHMQDYCTEFYIQMVKALTRKGKSRYDPLRAKWPQYVKKWLRLWTLTDIRNRLHRENVIETAIFRANEEYLEEGKTSEEIWEDIKMSAGVTGEVKSEKEIKELKLGIMKKDTP